MPKSSIKSKKSQSHREAVLKKKLWVYGLGFLALVTAFAVLTRIDALTINRVKIIGATEHESKIDQTVSAILERTYLIFIPKNNIFFIPRKEIETRLLQNFPRLLSAELDIQTKERILQIEVMERQSEAIWCRQFSDQEQCFFIDKTGVVFSEAPVFSGPVYFTYRGGELASSTQAFGRTIMPLEEFLSVERFIDELSDLGFEARELNISLAGYYEILLKQDLRILANSESLETGINNIDSAIKQGGLSVDEPFLNSLEYIDLRFYNRIYYK